MKNSWFNLLLLSVALPTFGQFTSSNLPIVLIDTDGGVEITKSRIGADMKIVSNIGDRNEVTGPYNNYNGRVAIKGRGSSSWERYDKKGYSLETQLASGENNNVSLLDLPAENDWVLHGPFADKTLMKNAFVYDVSRSMGRYAPRTKFCELIINGDYRGVYLLVERIKRDNNRVDISRLESIDVSGDALTGGYIIRIDRQEEEFWNPLIDFGFGLSFYNYYYPDPAIMPQVQKDYIKDYMEDFEVALFNQRFDDSPTGYRSFVDVSSFIDYFIISELTKNLDAYRLSTYMYKDRDSKGGKLTMGPIWDYNLSCGGVNIGFGDWPATAENWVSEELPGGVPFWWSTLLEDGYYTSCLKERWSALRANLINETQFNEIIDNYAAKLDEAKERNFEIFPLGEPVWGNNHSGFTYAQEIDTLKGFLRERMKWMDQEIASLPGGQECLECFQCGPLLSAVSKNQGLEVAPNPTTRNISIRFSLSTSTSVSFELYDMGGRKWQHKAFRLGAGFHELSIDLSDVDFSGTLIYKLSSTNETIGMGKLIKN